MASASRTVVILASGAALAVAGGVTAFVVTSSNPAPSSKASVTHVTAAQPPLRVVSVTPSDGSGGVNGANPVTVTYNQPLPASAPFPQLTPAVQGTWARSRDSVIFTPASGFPPSTRVRVTVPGTGATTRSEYSGQFTTAQYSTLRLQQVLAQLGYLPLTWTPQAGGTVTPGSPAAQAAAAYSPPAGSFTWQGGYPAQLGGMWKQGSPNMLDTGAIAGFEEAHGMQPNGTAGKAFWAALLKAAAAGQGNPNGYSYAIASESSPESLTIWHNGRQVLHTPANTGISVAPTVTGTYFVYLKLSYQIMSGTNPDGSHYADPVSWVSYFNGGDAVHYFPRGSFGYPQSLGCVELPYSAAKTSYGYLPYGTLVSVNP
ncbi:MAG TPA: L,D-transpeptidase family protein [Trebonia sp.]